MIQHLSHIATIILFLVGANDEKSQLMDPSKSCLQQGLNAIKIFKFLAKQRQSSMPFNRISHTETNH